MPLSSIMDQDLHIDENLVGPTADNNNKDAAVITIPQHFTLKTKRCTIVHDLKSYKSQNLASKAPGLFIYMIARPTYSMR